MNRHIYNVLFFVSLMASGLMWGMEIENEFADFLKEYRLSYNKMTTEKLKATCQNNLTNNVDSLMMDIIDESGLKSKFTIDQKNNIKEAIKKKDKLLSLIEEYVYKQFIRENKTEKESKDLVENYVLPWEKACIDWIETFIENCEIAQDEFNVEKEIKKEQNNEIKNNNEISDQKSNELIWHLVGEDGKNYSYRLKNEKIFGTYCATTKFDILITDQRNDKNLNLVYSTVKKEINFYEVKDNKESYEVSDDDKNNLINLLKSFANYFYS